MAGSPLTRSFFCLFVAAFSEVQNCSDSNRTDCDQADPQCPVAVITSPGAARSGGAASSCCPAAVFSGFSDVELLLGRAVIKLNL